MTISKPTSRWDYTGDGTSVVFTYDNLIFAATDLKVYVDGTLRSEGYSVSGVGNSDGGSVTFLAPPALGAAVVLVRDVPATQEITYPRHDPFPSIKHERGLDKLTVLVQQLLYRQGRVMRLADPEAGGDLLLPQDRANKFLAFDADRRPIAAEGVAGVPATAFGAGLIASDDAAGVRAHLRLDGIEGAQNTLINGDMAINQRGGDIAGYGFYVIAPHPYRWDSGRGTIRRHDMGLEDRSFERGYTLDRWWACINYYGATGGEGYIEQVVCLDAPEWVAGTSYTEGQLVRAPAGGYGAGYVYRCKTTHVAGATWNSDVQAAVDPGSFEAIPKLWSLAGIHETDPALQGKTALHWVQTAGSSGEVWLEQQVDDTRRFVGGGTAGIWFRAKSRGGSPLAAEFRVLQEFGVSTEDVTVATAITIPAGAGAPVQAEVTLVDPTQPTSGYSQVGRSTYTAPRIVWPAGATFDILITDVMFAPGDPMPFRSRDPALERLLCATYFQKTNQAHVPARWASFVKDNNGTVPGNTAPDLTDIHDMYGVMLDGVIYWGATNRAFQGNEREEAGRGKLRAQAERASKAYPSLHWSFAAPMRRVPQIKTYSVIDGREGVADNNNRRQASLRWDYTGAGASARPYAQRSVSRVAPFTVTPTAVDFNMQNLDPAEAWEDFSVSRTVATGQDVLGSAFLSLEQGRTYPWDWIASSVGTDVYYLALDTSGYTAWAAGQSVAPGDLRLVTGSRRVYQCAAAHVTDTAPTDADARWKPFGRISMPLKLQMDGVESTRANIADPSTMGGLQWYFGDKDNLGFKTLYVRMNSAPVDPGSAAGRLKAQSYDQFVDQFEEVFFQATASAEVLSE